MRWQSEPPVRSWPQIAALAAASGRSYPDRPSVWVALGRTFLNIGQPEEAVDYLIEAVGRMPEVAALRQCLASANFAIGRFEEALIHAEAALRIEPQNREAQSLRFSLLVQTHQWAAAEALVEDIVRIDPCHCYLYEVWWRQGHSAQSVAQLLARCEAALIDNPLCTHVVYIQALALAKLGRAREASETIMPAGTVQVFDLPAPAGYDSRAAFNRAIAAEIMNNATLAPDPRGKATKEGKQTRRLRQPDAPAVEILIGEIKIAVDRYVARLPLCAAGTPAMTPDKVELVSWAVIFQETGRERPHRHPAGWLSGVYYVAAPRLPEETIYQGPLLLGAINTKYYGIDPPWDIREIEPVPGRLVIFPSFVPHATRPTGLEGLRISVAFDVVAVS